MVDHDERRSRRSALGLLGGVGLGIAACSSGGATSEGPATKGGSAMSGSRLPTMFLPHGGGPWPFVDGLGGADEVRDLRAYLAALPPATTPRAVLVVSAHWEERVPTLMTAPSPPMLYDYFGFPDAAYEITWPAAGAPDLAAEVAEHLRRGGFETSSDAARGFDHGTFVPLKVAFPDAGVPTLQLSLEAGLDPERHLAIGRALAPLRDQGVLLVGSGMSYHNMKRFRDPGASREAEVFDAWLRRAATSPGPERDRLLADWAHAPAARASHPREEHLLPLMVVAGAAGEEVGAVPFTGTFYGKRISAIHFGAA
jgi:aromatic ring-opening dioxygenase catalytic subunit (LigB family)